MKMKYRQTVKMKDTQMAKKKNLVKQRKRIHKRQKRSHSYVEGGREPFDFQGNHSTD